MEFFFGVFFINRNTVIISCTIIIKRVFHYFKQICKSSEREHNILFHRVLSTCLAEFHNSSFNATDYCHQFVRFDLNLFGNWDINVLTSMPALFWHLGNRGFSLYRSFFLNKCIKRQFFINRKWRSKLLPTLKISSCVFLLIFVCNMSDYSCIQLMYYHYHYLHNYLIYWFIGSLLLWIYMYEYYIFFYRILHYVELVVTCTFA